MQPRDLASILAELSPVYNPQINNIRERQALIPQQIQAEEQGLQAQQKQSFDDILGGARQRGLGFAGIPLQEQAQYTATQFLPALARLRSGGREQALSMEDAILGVNERWQNQALGQRQYEQERYDQYLADQRSRAASNAQSNWWNLLNQQQQPQQQPQMRSLPQVPQGGSAINVGGSRSAISLGASPTAMGIGGTKMNFAPSSTAMKIGGTTALRPTSTAIPMNGTLRRF